jgi:hypothetical protein
MNYVTNPKPQTRIGVWHWAMFRNANNFLLPNSFIPERWLGDKRFVNDNKQSFQPFSYGPRNCIGKKYVIHFSSLQGNANDIKFGVRRDANHHGKIDLEL